MCTNMKSTYLQKSYNILSPIIILGLTSALIYLLVFSNRGIHTPSWIHDQEASLDFGELQDYKFHSVLRVPLTISAGVPQLSCRTIYKGGWPLGNSSCPLFLRHYLEMKYQLIANTSAERESYNAARVIVYSSEIVVGTKGLVNRAVTTYALGTSQGEEKEGFLLQAPEWVFPEGPVITTYLPDQSSTSSFTCKPSTSPLCLDKDVYQTKVNSPLEGVLLRAGNITTVLGRRDASSSPSSRDMSGNNGGSVPFVVKREITYVNFTRNTNLSDVQRRVEDFGASRELLCTCLGQEWQSVGNTVVQKCKKDAKLRKDLSQFLDRPLCYPKPLLIETVPKE